MGTAAQAWIGRSSDQSCAGVTQTQLALAIGVSQATVSRIESGERVPTLAGFLDISHALGVPYADLLEQTERFDQGKLLRKNSIVRVHESQAGS